MFQSHFDCGTRTLARGERLFSQGQIGPLWSVEWGLVLLFMTDGSDDMPVGIALPGDVIGSESLWGDVYSLDAVAVSKSRVRQVVSAVKSRTEREVQKIINQQLRRQIDLIRLRSGSISDRIKTLNLLFDRAGFKNIDRCGTNVLPTGKDIARLIDSRPETVSRQIKKRMSTVSAVS